MASSLYDMLLCSRTLVADLRNASEFLVPGFSCTDLLCRDKFLQARGLAAYVRDGYGAFTPTQVCVWLLSNIDI